MRNLLAVALLVASLDARAAITGRVLDEGGSAVAGARIRAYRIESSDEWLTRAVSDSPDPVAIATTQTAADGTFSIKTDPFVMLLADKDGRAELLYAADGESKTIALTSAMRSGRVLAQGKGVAGARLFFDRVFVTRSGEDGSFSVPESMTRFVDPFVYASGYAVGPPRPARRRRARELGDIELDRGVTLRGQVVAADGSTPVAGAIVTVDGIPLARSNADGTFVVEHAARSWKVLAAREGTRVAIALPGKGNAYLLKLRPGAVVTGTVRSSKDETPLPGTRVMFLGPHSSQRAAVTDSKGAFSMTALPPGMYRISAVRHRFTGGWPREVRLTEGGKLQRALILHPFPIVSGVVVDAEKKPLAGVEVDARTDRTRTAPDGTFEVGIAANRPVPIMVRKQGYAPVVAGPFQLDEGERKRDVRVVLPKGIAFRLRVVDRTGAPVEDEPVGIAFAPDEEEMYRNDAWVCLPPAQCATDERGIYETQLAEGSYDFIVGGEDSVLRRQRHAVTEETPSLTLTVERGASVRGRVVAPEGGTLPDSGLFVASKKELISGPSTGVPVEPDGTFVIAAAPPGRLTLFVQHRAGALTSGPETEITAPADDVVLVAPKLSRIEGKVVDRETRQPISDFSIMQRRNRGSGWSAGSPQSFHSDDGAFVLESVPEGSVDLTVTAPGYAPAVLSNVTAEGRAEPLIAQLERGASVTGRVTRAGKGVSEASVSVVGGGQMRGPGLNAMTDAEGEFAFDGLGAGEYHLQVFKRGLPPARKSLEVVVGRDVRVEIDVPPGATISGRVVDEAGRPVARARVMSRLPGSGMTAPAQSDADGMFALEGLTGDRLTITAEKAGYVPAVAEDVPVASAAPLTLTLRRGATITGRVRGLSDAELMATRIAVFGTGVRTSTRPDPSGNFTLTGVVDGRLNIVATLESRGGPGRSVQEQVEVTNGSAPPVDLDFSAAFIVSGRVTRGGAPHVGSLVMFQPMGRGERAARADVDSQGRYELRVSQAGDYRVFVESGGSGNIEAGVVNVTGSMTHDIDLGGASLRGRVVDSSTNQPVAGAQIQANAVEARGMLHATSDADGRFSFDVIAPGRYQLRTSKQRYATAIETVDVREAGNPDLEVRIREGERAALNVLDTETRRPLEMVAITITDGAKRVVNTGQPFREDDGSFRVWLEPGRYTARVWAQGYVSATTQINVPGPEATVLMSRAGRVVLQGTHEGAVRMRLSELATGKTVMQTGIPPGVFENVTPGSYKLELLDANQAIVGTFTVVVAPGHTATVG